MIHTCYHTVIDSPSGIKRYFGKHSTESIEDGYSGSGNYVSLAKKKEYPIHVIDRCILEDEDLAFEFEQLLVEEAKSKYGKSCVNMKPGGKGGCVSVQSEESNIKRSLSLKGKKRPDSVIEKIKMTKSMNPYVHDEETRKKMSDSAKKRRATPEQRKARSDRTKGKPIPSLRSELWKYEEELYQLWLKNPLGKTTFRKYFVTLGYPDLDAGYMVKTFRMRSVK